MEALRELTACLMWQHQLDMLTMSKQLACLQQKVHMELHVGLQAGEQQVTAETQQLLYKRLELIISQQIIALPILTALRSMRMNSVLGYQIVMEMD